MLTKSVRVGLVQTNASVRDQSVLVVLLQYRVCVCLLLQYLLQSCSRGGGGIVEDMCYERLRAEACVD
jgi:hypothetical protein